MAPLRRSEAAALLVVACLTLGRFGMPRSAQAEDARSAREHTARATAAYNLGHYDEAAGEFETAYRLIQDPALLFNVAQAHRLAGHDEKALTAYKAYLRTADPDAENRESALKWKQTLEQHPREAAPSTATPPSSPPSSPAGSTVSLVPRQTAEPAAAPLEITQVQPQHEETRPIYTRRWAWTILGAALAGVATVFILNRDTHNPDCLGISPCGSVH